MLSELESPIRKSHETMAVEWTTQNVLIACYFNSIAAIISTCTATLAIIVYFKSLTIRQAYQNLLLLNLLINSIIFSINAIVFYGQMAIVKNPSILTIEWACSLNGFINMFCPGMEIYTLMCIAIERYFSIVKQKPLTLKQIIRLLLFGWLEIGLLTSVPFWNSTYFFALADGKFYCSFPLSDQTQIIMTLLSAANASMFVAVGSFCYIKIYFFCTKLKKNVRANMNSTVQPNEMEKKRTEKELKILWTTILLVGWTLMGWTPMLIMVGYQIISGNIPNIHWDMVSSVLVNAAICGDSIILLLYDLRWKASVRDMMSKRN